MTMPNIAFGFTCVGQSLCACVYARVGAERMFSQVKRGKLAVGVTLKRL